MKFLVTALVVVIAGVIVALAARGDPGYILMSYRGWTAETTMAVFVAALLALFAVLYAVARLLINTGRLPRALARWRQARRRARGRRCLADGLLALAEGRWRDAEDRLLRHVGDSDVPALHYLAAARAAQRQGVYTRGDDYIARARPLAPQSPLAAGLADAELHIAANQPRKALEAVHQLHVIAPKHPHVLRLMMQLHAALRDWERVLALMPDLRKYRAAEHEDLAGIERTAYMELMAAAARAKDLPAILDVWRRVPKELRGHEALLQEYVRDLVVCDANVEANNAVYQALLKRWYQPLVYLYGLVEDDAALQLGRAEAWLPDHRDDPTLLLTLGRLSIRASLWGKARAYLEASLAIDPKPETYKELGDLLNHLGDGAAAMDCYRRGLSLVAAVAAKNSAAPPKVVVGPRSGDFAPESAAPALPAAEQRLLAAQV